MNDINLLRPLQEQEQTVAKSRGKNSFYITFTIILLVVISVVIFGSKFLLSSQSKTLDSQISSLERDVGEVKSTEDKINNFNSTIAKLKSLDKINLNWSQVYDNIAKSTPADVKLNQVTQVTTTASGGTTTNTSSTSASPSPSAAAAKLKLKITGEAKSERAIALFQYKLQKVGGSFVTVDIISTQKSAATATTSPSPGTTSQPQAAGNIKFEIDIALKTS
jgi:Tfp pilus assembly protein PilO